MRVCIHYRIYHCKYKYSIFTSLYLDIIRNILSMKLIRNTRLEIETRIVYRLYFSIVSLNISWKSNSSSNSSDHDVVPQRRFFVSLWEKTFEVLIGSLPGFYITRPKGRRNGWSDSWIKVFRLLDDYRRVNWTTRVVFLLEKRWFDYLENCEPVDEQKLLR